MDLPPDIDQFIKASLTEHGLPENDQLAMIVRVQAHVTDLMERRRRRGLLIYVTPLIGIFSLFGYMSGYFIARQDVSKARPVITMTSVGGGVMYGTQSGRDVIAISSGNRHIEDAWKNGETAYVLVK